MNSDPIIARKDVDDLERKLAEVTKQRDKLADALARTASDFVTFRKVARVNGIVGTLGLESLELAAAALAAAKGGEG